MLISRHLKRFKVAIIVLLMATLIIAALWFFRIGFHDGAIIAPSHADFFMRQIDQGLYHEAYALTSIKHQDLFNESKFADLMKLIRVACDSRSRRLVRSYVTPTQIVVVFQTTCNSTPSTISLGMVPSGKSWLVDGVDVH